MATRILGAAVVGLRMGNQHCRAYVRNPHVRIVAVCDPDTQLLARRKDEYGADVAVTDYRQLLDRAGVDVVSVASPDYYHAEQSVAFLRAGKHVLCEKPLTLDLDESRQIVAAVEETGRKFMVGQVCRYAPGFVLVKKMVDRGEIGRLFCVESEYAHSYRRVEGVGSWRKDARRFPFTGGGCHAVDLLRWISGDPAEVAAYSNHKCLTDWPVDDCTVAIFKFPNDVIGKVMVSIGCVRPYTMRSVFYGTEGTIICDNTSNEIHLCSEKNVHAGDGSGKPAFATFPVDISSHNVIAEIDEFVDCILHDKPVVTDVYQGARTVAACTAVVASARSGKPEKVPSV